MVYYPDTKNEIQSKLPRTLQGTACIWHEFWKQRQRHTSTPGVRARAWLSRPQGQRHFVLETGSGQHFVVDDSEGDTRPQANELVVAALAESAAYEVIDFLRRKKQQRVTGYEVRVEADQAERPPQAIVAVRIHHIVTGEGVDPAAVSEAIRVCEESCAVQALLRHTATITMSYEVVNETAERQ
jgi:uncharacterized OsmC-like protein